jgi:hypothetical protein
MRNIGKSFNLPLCVLTTLTALALFGCSSSSPPREQRPFAMVPGESVPYSYPRGEVTCERRVVGTWIQFYFMDSGPVTTCTQITDESCRVTTCEWAPDGYATLANSGTVTLSSGANSQTFVASGEEDVTPADFWEPGAPVKLEGSVPGVPALSETLTGPADVDLSAPEFYPLFAGTYSARPIRLDTSRDFDVAWSGGAGTLVDVTLKCDDIHDDPGHSTEVRCAVPGEVGALTIPSSLLHYLPTVKCRAGDILISSQSEKQVGSDWPYTLLLQRPARNAEGVEASASMLPE